MDKNRLLEVDDFKELVEIIKFIEDKDDIEFIVKNTKTIMKKFNSNLNMKWMNYFTKKHNDIRPLEIGLKAKTFTAKEVVEFNFVSDNLYYKNQDEYKTLFELLTTYKIDNLDFFKSNTSRGFLPEVIVENPDLFDNVMENWEFEYDTSQRILTFLLQDGYYSQFKFFLDVKDSKKYPIKEWYDLQELMLRHLCAKDPFFLKYLFDDGWLDFEFIGYHHILDFVSEQINTADTSTIIILIEKYLQYFRNPPPQEFLLEKILKKFTDDDLHDSIISRKIMQVFLKNTNLDDPISYMWGEAEIMIYLPEDHPLRKILLSNDKFVNFLLQLDKTEYLPNDVKEIFVF